MPKQTTILQRKTDAINKLSDELQSSVLGSEKKLARLVVRGFVSKLDVANGVIANTAKNKGLVALIDKIYSSFLGTSGQDMIDILTGGVDDMEKLNKEYYKAYSTKEQLNKAARAANKEVQQVLGIDDNGELIQQGYLENLLRDGSVKNKIKNFARRAILTGINAVKFADDMETYITGNDSRNGLLSQYYKPVTGDVIAQADRVTSTVYSNELGLVFALYEGGIVPATRKFCRQRNGKVFHISEILAFSPTVAVPPAYNPIIDLGGYGCRHHLNWISTELALVLRPAAKKFL